MLQRCIFLGIALLLISGFLLADEGRKGQAGFQFLQIPAGTREVAMGNCGLASSVGASAFYWNPAGVAAAQGYEMQFSNVQWFGGVAYQQFIGTSTIGNIGTMGLSIQYLSYPEIVETTEVPDGTGAMIAPYDMAVGLNFSRMMTDHVAFGMNLKFISENIAFVSASAFAVDIGLSYKTGFQGLQLGFAIRNYGTKGQFSGSGLKRFIMRTDGPPNQTAVPVMIEADEIELPSSVQGGFSFLPIMTDDISLLIGADYVVNTFSSDRTNIGAEFVYDNRLFFRGGYFFNSDFSASKNGQLTFGVGLHYPITEDFQLSFDYAYVDLGILKSAQYITVGMNF